MQNEHSHSPEPTQAEPCESSGCMTTAVERMRYYTGRYMAARDFCDEQFYFLTHSRLRNRLLHGWGVVCGLDVRHHPDWLKGQKSTRCALSWVVVQAGMAIDCCGRELILSKDVYYELPPLHRPTAGSTQPTTSEEETANDARQQEPNQGESAGKRHFLLGLQYKEELVECVPALYAEGACDPKKVEANRVREGWKLVEVDYTDELKGKCWADSSASYPPTYYDDCGVEGGDRPAEGCLRPECPCGDMVPLALIEYDPDNLQAGFEISRLGRRELPPSPDVLTHIVHINWPHGGSLKRSDLEREGWELRVTFDRDLLDPESYESRQYAVDHPYGRGVNEHTFTVHLHRWSDYAFTPMVLFNDREPPTVRDKRVAVFKINEELLTGRATIVGAMLYVTIKCDFVLDCHGHPVDGNHLKGQLRTGNGAPGGIFESWFRIVSQEGETEPGQTTLGESRLSSQQQSNLWGGRQEAE